MLKVLQSEKLEPYGREKFWADLKAGTIGFASAMPIVMALGILSGIGPVAGLHCFIIVGLVAALLGGARMLVSGPSVAMAVIVSTILADNGGDLAELALIAVMAGGMQVLLEGCSGLAASSPICRTSSWPGSCPALARASCGRRPPEYSLPAWTTSQSLVFPSR